MNDKHWFLYVVDHHEGPFTIEEIQEIVRMGQARSSSYVWREGMGDWIMMSDVPEFATGSTLEGHDQPRIDLEALKVDYPKQPAINPENSSTKASTDVGTAVQRQILQGGVSVPKSPLWKSKLFLVLLIVVGFAGYQFIATQGWVPQLKPVPLDGSVAGVASIPKRLGPALVRLLGEHFDGLPEPVQDLFSPIDRIENVTEDKMKALRKAAIQSKTDGNVVAVAVAAGDELNPIFHLATNMDDGTVLTLTLTGKPGTLIGTQSYQKSVDVEVVAKVARTPQFSGESLKPGQSAVLPRGEYTIVVTSRQDPTLQWREDLFLGGKRDAGYSKKLAEYQQKLKEQENNERLEAEQIASTVEASLNEDFKKFDAVFPLKNLSQRQKIWKLHHDEYEKLNTQLKQFVAQRKSSLDAGTVVHRDWVELSLRLVDESNAFHEILSKEVNEKGSVPPEQLRQTQLTAFQTLKELKSYLGRQNEGQSKEAGTQTSTVPTQGTAGTIDEQKGSGKAVNP